MSQMLETIKTLCRLPGPSGWEDAVRDYIKAEAAPYADEIIVDNLGNLLVFKKGRKSPKKPIMLAAHMDEVGVVIKEIDDDGYLRFGFLGGIDRRVVIGKRVWIGRNRVPGVIGMKPIHLTTPGERQSVPALKELYIDIGAKDGDEARSLVVRGDYGVFDDRVIELQNDMIRMKAIDDRVGCGILLTLLKEELPVDTWFVFTIQEEAGCRGAFGAAFKLQPGIAVVVEGTTAADSPASIGARKVCMPFSPSAAAINSLVKLMVTTPFFIFTPIRPQSLGRGAERPLSGRGPLASSRMAVVTSAVENTVRVTGTSIRPVEEGK